MAVVMNSHKKVSLFVIVSILNFHFSILNFQFSIFNSQFSIFNFQFSIFNFQLSDSRFLRFNDAVAPGIKLRVFHL